MTPSNRKKNNHGLHDVESASRSHPLKGRRSELWNNCYTRAVEHIERDSARREQAQKLYTQGLTPTQITEKTGIQGTTTI